MADELGVLVNSREYEDAKSVYKRAATKRGKKGKGTQAATCYTAPLSGVGVWVNQWIFNFVLCLIKLRTLRSLLGRCCCWPCLLAGMWSNAIVCSCSHGDTWKFHAHSPAKRSIDLYVSFCLFFWCASNLDCWLASASLVFCLDVHSSNIYGSRRRAVCVDESTLAKRTV